nr:hypothetical protein StreXyl84_65990 [Streptomyces sp. Xyl84]
MRERSAPRDRHIARLPGRRRDEDSELEDDWTPSLVVLPGESTARWLIPEGRTPGFMRRQRT